ncbi:hypothetical protein MKX01_011761 [Papaver californicum]|nr:hypothetical protein MKX01_011761 [Papaver californicum]
MAFMSPLGLGAQIIGRRRRPHRSRVVKPNEVNITPTSRFQLKPHGQKRKKEFEVETKEKKGRGNDGCTFSSKTSVFNFNNDQEDIVAHEILSWLPVKSLVRFKCVCKYWSFLIQEDKTFINLHLERSKSRPCLLISNFIRDKNAYQLMAANLLFGTRQGGAVSAATFHTIREVDFTDCDLMLKPVNGLIGFFGEGRINPGVCICNFSTREVTPWIESKLLRDVRSKDIYASRDCPMATCKLGYDPVTKEHKVVGIWRSSKPSYEVCEVLTVGENEWRQIEEVLPYSLELHGSSVYINGSIYYSTDSLMVSKANDKNKSKFIVVFDVGREKFRTIRVPSYIFDQPDYDASFIFYHVILLDLDGRLGLLIKIAKDGYTPKLWLFDDDKNKKKSTNSWTGIAIELPGDLVGCSFSPVSGTYQIILTSYVETSNGKKSDTRCHLYNWKQKSFDEIQISGIPSVSCLSSTSRVATFFENLLPVQKRSSYRDSGVDEMIDEDYWKRQVGGD